MEQLKRQKVVHGYDTRFAVKSNRDYKQWLDNIDREVKNCIGVERCELHDAFLYYDMFISEMSSSKVAKLVIEQNYQAWEKSVWKNIIAIPYYFYIEINLFKYFETMVSYLITARYVEAIFVEKMGKNGQLFSKWLLSLETLFFPNGDIDTNELTQEYLLHDWKSEFDRGLEPFEAYQKYFGWYKWLCDLLSNIKYFHKKMITYSDLPRNLAIDLYINGVSLRNASKEISNFFDFNHWKFIVENIVYERIGLSLSDLSDEDYMANYENKTSPREMANIVLGNYENDCRFVQLLYT